VDGFDAKEIGQRLRAFRVASGHSADQIAESIGVSRAALYRYEKGDPLKLEVLEKIAGALDASVPTLLGVGVEYVASAVGFFERMRQIEETCEHVFVMFGPVSYLLTTDDFDTLLPTVLHESIPANVPDRANAEQAIGKIATILRARKENYRSRKPSIISLVSVADIKRFLLHGFVGTDDLPARTVAQRRRAARREVESIIDMLEAHPIGVQIGVLVDTIPNMSFQIFRQADRSVLAVSPFRLGEYPNVRLGVAMLTSSPEAIKLHGRMTEELWNRCLKGPRAAEHVRTYLDD